jgi:cytoskeletal protein RodZ
MDELGSILREAREAKGYTLEEAQATTKISIRYLRALEEGQYELLPTPVHIRGFLRNYARFLALDPEPLLARYESYRNGHRGHARGNGALISPDQPLPPRTEQPFFDPVNMDLDGSSRKGPESTLRIVVIIALLLAIALAASRFVPLLLGRGDGQETLTQTIETLLENRQAAEFTPAPTEQLLDPSVTPLPINPTSRNNPSALPTAALPTPTRPPLPATMDIIRLRLDITERTWVRVTVDGEVVLEGQFTVEDGPFQWEAQEAATLLTGNGAGVFVTINDIELGRLAGRGEVWEETWNTTGN